MFVTPSCGDNATRPIRSLTEPSAEPTSPRSKGSDGQLPPATCGRPTTAAIAAGRCKAPSDSSPLDADWICEPDGEAAADVGAGNRSREIAQADVAFRQRKTRRRCGRDHLRRLPGRAR